MKWIGTRIERVEPIKTDFILPKRVEESVFIGLICSIRIPILTRYAAFTTNFFTAFWLTNNSLAAQLATEAVPLDCPGHHGG